METMRRRRWGLWVALAFFVLILAALGWALLTYLPLYRELERRGVFTEPELRSYQGTSQENLKALHRALMAYHDSEERFPDAQAWMDAALPYTRTSDLKEDEERKKFQNPLIRPGGTDVYGYGFNEALAGKFVDDIADPERTVLIYDSQETGWNAHGDPNQDAADPERAGGNLGITVGGRVGTLDELARAPEPREPPESR